MREERNTSPLYLSSVNRQCIERTSRALILKE